jgi:hypothetical protein
LSWMILSIRVRVKVWRICWLWARRKFCRGKGGSGMRKVRGRN